MNFKMLYKPSVTSEEDEVFGFKRDSALNEQVRPDVFLPPKRCCVTQNTICCVHSSICQKLNWRENCCNTDPNNKQDMTADFTQRVSSHEGWIDSVALFLFKETRFLHFCTMKRPFNCEALMGSGLFWQGHLSLLTFLTQFPRTLLFMCTWKQEADMWGGNWMTQRRLQFGPIPAPLWRWSLLAELSPEQPGHKKNTELMLSARKFSELWPNMDNDFA